MDTSTFAYLLTWTAEELANFIECSRILGHELPLELDALIALGED